MNNNGTTDGYALVSILLQVHVYSIFHRLALVFYLWRISLSYKPVM